jgi:hypothetical protein
VDGTGDYNLYPVMNIDLVDTSSRYGLTGYATKIIKTAVTQSGYAPVITAYKADVNGYDRKAYAYYANALASAGGTPYAFYSDSGMVRIGTLATTLPAPATEGTTKYVVTDSNGNISFTSLNVPRSKPSSSNDSSGNVGDITWDEYEVGNSKEAYIYIKTSGAWRRMQLSTQAF